MKTWYHCLRHPKTASEARANAAFKVDADMQEYGVKARLRGRKTRNRLASLYDDVYVSAYLDKYYGKQTHSAARKQKEREKGRLLAA